MPFLNDFSGIFYDLNADIAESAVHIAADGSIGDRQYGVYRNVTDEPTIGILLVAFVFHAVFDNAVERNVGYDSFKIVLFSGIDLTDYAAGKRAACTENDIIYMNVVDNGLAARADKPHNSTEAFLSSLQIALFHIEIANHGAANKAKEPRAVACRIIKCTVVIKTFYCVAVSFKSPSEGAYPVPHNGLFAFLERGNIHSGVEIYVRGKHERLARGCGIVVFVFGVRIYILGKRNEVGSRADIYRACAHIKR